MKLGRAVYSLVILLVLTGCSTVSQNDVFDGVKKETGQSVQWIKTPQEAALVNKIVN